MLPTKYQPNRPGCSGEEALLILLPHLWHDSHLEVPIKTVLRSYFSFPQSLEATYEIWLHLAH